MTSTDWHPLTNAQEAYWDEFVQHPDKPLSTVAHCLEISGSVDIKKLELAINKTVSDAEVLCLKFQRVDNKLYPVQTVNLDDKPYVDVIDLRDVSNALEKANANMYLDIESVIDLEKDHITKVQIYVINPEKVIWYLRTHHIAVDGYSMHLIEQRCAFLYQCLLEGKEPHSGFKAFDVYIKENADYLESKYFDIDQSYWNNYLDLADLELFNMDTMVSDTTSAESDVPESVSYALAAISKKLMIGWSDILILLCVAYLYQYWRREERALGPLPVWLPFMNRMGNPCANTPSLMVNTIPYLAVFNHDEPIELFLKRSVKELRYNYRHGRYRIENKLASGGHYFLSPFINVLPFEPPEFDACSTAHRVIAGGIADGFNVTFRSSKQATNMSLKIEAESRLFNEFELQQYSNGLLKYLSEALESCRGL